jgi:hypothetical protein
VVLNSGGKKNKNPKNKKRKIPKIVATFVYASSQGQRTLSARTKMLYSSLGNRLVLLAMKQVSIVGRKQARISREEAVIAS